MRFMFGRQESTFHSKRVVAVLKWPHCIAWSYHAAIYFGKSSNFDDMCVKGYTLSEVEKQVVQELQYRYRL